MVSRRSGYKSQQAWILFRGFNSIGNRQILVMNNIVVITDLIFYLWDDFCLYLNCGVLSISTFLHYWFNFIKSYKSKALTIHCILSSTVTSCPNKPCGPGEDWTQVHWHFIQVWSWSLPASGREEGFHGSPKKRAWEGAYCWCRISLIMR